MTDAVVPWDKPTSHYDSEKPIHGEPFEVDGVKFKAEWSDESPDTMRDRFAVTCLDCKELIHPRTNGPRHWIRVHLQQSHNFQGEVKYQNE